MSDLSTQSVFDLASLHRTVGKGAGASSVKEAATEFESLLVRQLLSSMRKVNELFSEDSYFSSSAGDFYQGLWDDQMAAEITRAQGGLLASQMTQQLTGAREARTLGLGVGALPPVSSGGFGWRSKAAAVTPSAPRTTAAEGEALPPAVDKPESFVAWVRPVAEQVAARTGLPLPGLVAQAALETGWGQFMSRDAEGRPSYNLFNIKAGKDWKGPVVYKDTLEYDGDAVVQKREAFRAYESLEDGFEDFVQLVMGRDRYEQVSRASGKLSDYFSALQSAGYATDPHYAKKLERVAEHPAVRDLPHASP
jgi:flagellar protein FlgJ